MTYDPTRHHRRSIRLRHFDYSSPGVYFVTIVVRRRLCLWGEIADGEMRLNDAGMMVAQQWQNLAERFPFCEPSTFVVMPNHFHGLLIFKPLPLEGETSTSQPPDFRSVRSPAGTLKDSLGRVMQAFKSLTTNEYIQGVRQRGWPPYEKQVWLRNYWERIVRDEREWRKAHEYIEQNPARWQLDKYHPSNAPSNDG